MGKLIFILSRTTSILLLVVVAHFMKLIGFKYILNLLMECC